MALIGPGPLFFAIYDFVGRCVFLNDSWLMYTGTSLGSQLGVGWTLCVHPEDRPELLERWRDAIAVGNEVNIDVRVRASGGEYRWFKHHVVRRQQQSDDGGERWFGTSTDVTYIKERLLALEAEARYARELSALAVHELRNALMPLSHALRVLEHSKDASIDSSLHQQMRRQVNHLARTIEDLFDVARDAAGKLTLNRSPIDVRDVVQSALELAEPLMEVRGHRLVLHAPAESTVLACDRVRLVQALSNILINAAQYSPAGATITLSVTAMASGFVRLEVQDDGPGLTKEALSRIFVMYEHSGRNVDHRGLGVGLTLAKRFVELHGGSLEAQSAGPGHGSTFTIDLPVERPSSDSGFHLA